MIQELIETHDTHHAGLGMRILLVEDDKDLAKTIAEYLSRENYRVEISHDGEAGQEKLAAGGFDVLILDWELPGLTGVELMKDYRANGGTSPIIMLTGRNKMEDKEIGFDSGSDDYLTKPFNLRELSARLRSLLRRPPALLKDILTVGPVVLDPIKHRVTKCGVELKLTPKDFALLEFLMRHPEELFSVETILARVWLHDEEASGDALRVAIRRLRKALGETGDPRESIIQNIARLGYRLKAS